MPHRSPLEVVRVVKSRAVDEAADAARVAADEATRARVVAARARDDEQAAREDAAARGRAEQDALAPAASPRELAQLAAFEHGLETKLARDAALTRDAERRAAEAAVVEDGRRALLVQAKGALDVVEKHQARTRAADAERERQALDEAAEEAHAARRPRR